MNKAADVFFEHFGIKPGGAAADIHRIAETFSELPWENLTKFLLKASGDARLRFPLEVMEDHVFRGTGGTCFSLTETLGGIIASCGFSARPITGHMGHGRNVHCALLVQGEPGCFILDPGYVLPGAVVLSPDGWGVIHSPGRKMIWKPVADGWELHTTENGITSHRYTLESRILSRGEFLLHWKNSLNATGMNSLHLNRPNPSGGRISAHNENMRAVGEGFQRNIKLSEDYASLIHKHFGVAPEIAGAAWMELQKQREQRRNVTS